jgi:L-lactate dehydrogenase
MDSEAAAPTTAHPKAALRPSKLAVVGAGAVGATLAYAALIRGAAREVALYDINKAKVEAEALAIGHGIQFMPMGSIVGSDDVNVCADADMIVITSGARQKPGQSRLELAGATVNIMRSLVPQLVNVAPNAIYMLVANPVDVVTYASMKISGLPANQMFGSGTVLDTGRLRYLVSLRTQTAVQNVHAFIVGEHGDTEFALWSSANIASIPLSEWPQTGPRALSIPERELIAKDVVNSAYKIIEGKGATNYAVGLACTRIIEAVLRDEDRVLPVSSLLHDYKGVNDVCLSVPSIVNANGVEDVLEVPMDEFEVARLQASAEKIRSVAASLGF